MSTSYTDPIVETYLNLFRTNVSGIRKFFNGDPISIPQSQLPALILTKVQTVASPMTNASDEHTLTMTATIVTTVKDDFANPEGVEAGYKKLVEIIEARNSSTLALETGSILGLLRSNQNVDTGNNLRTDIAGNSTTVDYSAVIGGTRALNGISVEGVVTFTVNYQQNT